MDNTAFTLVVIVVVGALLLLAGLKLGQALAHKEQTWQLQTQFGPEYKRGAARFETQEKDGAELLARQKRVAPLDLRPLPPAETQRYSDRWQSTQASFVDQPAQTLGEADRLVNQVMRAWGYPMENFEQRAAEISLDHPALVRNYRGARAILQKSRRQEAGIDDLRQAMIHYRALFEDLLGLEAEYQKAVTR